VADEDFRGMSDIFEVPILISSHTTNPAWS